MDKIRFLRTVAIGALGLGAVVLIAQPWLADPDQRPDRDRQTVSTPAFHPKDPITLAPPDQRPVARPLVLVTDDGTRTRLQDRIGTKPVLLHFWATWCGPCIPEMPEIDSTAQRLAPRLTVVAVAMDRTGAQAARAFFTHHRIATLSALGVEDDSETPDLLPTTQLLDKQGRIAWQTAGAHDWQAGDLDRAITQLTAE